MKSESKAFLLMLALVVFTSMAFCQDNPHNTDASPSVRNSFYDGTFAGKNDAQGNFAYGLGGFACGLFGVAAAAISDPQPDPQKVIFLQETKGTDYVTGYITSYNKESRKKNLSYSAVGWGAFVAAYVAYYALVYAAAEEDSDYYKYGKDPHKLGIKVPLGNPAAGFSHNN